MKLFITLLTLSLLCVSFAQIGGYFRSNEHPGKCFYDGKALSPGEKYKPLGKCKSFVCTSALGYGQIFECGIQQVSFPCELGDFLKPYAAYPDCCEREVYCPKKRMIIYEKKKVLDFSAE